MKKKLLFIGISTLLLLLGLNAPAVTFAQEPVPCVENVPNQNEENGQNQNCNTDDGAVDNVDDGEVS